MFLLVQIDHYEKHTSKCVERLLQYISISIDITRINALKRSDIRPVSQQQHI
jgi:hypothetical protein